MSTQEYSLLVVARYSPALGALTESQKEMVEQLIKRNLEASLFTVAKVELVKEV